MNRTARVKEQGLLVGVSFIALQLCLMVAAALPDLGIGSMKHSTSEIIGGVYIQVWGLLFLLSYYFEDRSFLFRALMWICENFSTGRTREMAFFFFALALFVGTASIMKGLGYI